MKQICFTLLVTTAFVILPASVDAIDSPYDVGNKAQLFVDRVLVHSADGVSFTLHEGKKHLRNPLVKVDRSWEGWRLEIYGSVLYDEDEKIFKMWYLGEAPDDFPYYAVLYATSRDGITWEKPLVGTIKSLRGGKHNGVANGYLLASVIKDKQDSDASRRYKMICWRQRPPHGAQTMVSPDGLNWTQVGERPICRSSDVITGFYDHSRQQYVAFPKLNTMVRGQVRRCFGLTTSKDFINWTPSRPVFLPDARDDAGSLVRIEAVRHILDQPDNPQLMRTEFYGIGAYPHESCTLAFPWILTINANARYGNHEGPMEIQLAASRDLEHWERHFRTPIVPLGEKGSWDEGILVTASSAIRVDDEIRLYYGGANYTHGTPVLYRKEGTGRLHRYTGSIGLATWKLDRFVSVDGPRQGGSLTTVPIRFSGRQLQINAATKPNGTIRVELLDAAGDPLDGYTHSHPFSGDGFRETIIFGGQKDISALAGEPVVLRFHLSDASLFSFAFRD